MRDAALFVVFVERKDVIRLISARLATSAERKLYYDQNINYWIWSKVDRGANEGNVLLVGINYEKKSKKHQCRIGKLEW